MTKRSCSDNDAGLTRREAVGRLAVGSVAAMTGPTLLAGGSPTSKPAPHTNRPNVLFLLADDHRWDCLGAAGHPVIRTPNLDRIAAEGARFANAFCVTSLCCPSRASFLTGLYGAANGVTHNGPTGGTILPDVPTIGQLFQRAGYRTTYVGKWHIGDQYIVQPGWDHWTGFFGQGAYLDPVLNVNGNRYRLKGHMTDLLTKVTVEQLSRQADHPFCMMVSYKAAHPPCVPPARHTSLYADAELPQVPTFHEDLSGKPAYVQKRAAYMENQGKLVPRAEQNVAWWGRHVRNYYRCIVGIDDSVGRILAALASQGRLDNTIIVYAGDNGLMLRDHQLLDKRSAYEPSMRIPLLMRFPGKVPTGCVIEQAALNIDLLPTLLQACGIEYDGPLHGRSLLPVIAGTETSPREGFLYAYWQDDRKRLTPSIRAYRTPDAKYIHHLREGEIDELYDLQADPNETVNLTDDPAFAKLKKDLQRRMLERMRAIGDNMLDRVEKELHT